MSGESGGGLRVPASTYRLQIGHEFDLFDAAGVTDYLAALGVGWVYLSPILTAERGSPHGYDVVDHSTVDPARGGPAGLDAAIAAVRRVGLGVLVDIVPNHVGAATPLRNKWWRHLLTYGRSSRYAEAFDIDWEFGGGKLRVPILGDEEEPRLSVVDGELHYEDHRFPLAPGTIDGESTPEEVHERQHYELVKWRRADAELNYRRFFAVNTLPAIRVEVPWVFEESHVEIVRWVREGLVDGLRVDHPDGLADPGGYLQTLQGATGGTYVVVEKVLRRDERLPPTWEVAGTTGYDALGDFDRVLIDTSGRLGLDAIDGRVDGGEATAWGEVVHDAKREVVDGMFRSEVLRLEREISASARTGGTRAAELSTTADAVAELLACFPVYRSYLPFGGEHLDEAVRSAISRRPDLAETILAVSAVLADAEQPAAIRFQQTSGMVVAKGVEDTAFYRYTRLGSLTEVGADPAEFSIEVDEFHRRQQRRHDLTPMSLTALSTHDTKRGEDVRARLSVLAEIPEKWGRTLEDLRNHASLSDSTLEQLLWQSIIGTWPASRERLHTYAVKAAREAGRSTTWTSPDEHFERRLHDFVDRALGPGPRELIVDLVRIVEGPGRTNSLSAKLLQLTAPGVPDVFQGSELWAMWLVDPDNRRPVDFTRRRELLAEIDSGALPEIDDTGAAKLLVTTRALRLRRDHPQLFTRYTPLHASGPAAHHAVAFDRGGAITIATRLPIGLEQRGGWADTTIMLDDRPAIDMITGRHVDGGSVVVGDLLGRYPVALLAPADGVAP